MIIIIVVIVTIITIIINIITMTICQCNLVPDYVIDVKKIEEKFYYLCGWVAHPGYVTHLPSVEAEMLIPQQIINFYVGLPHDRFTPNTFVLPEGNVALDRHHRHTRQCANKLI